MINVFRGVVGEITLRLLDRVTVRQWGRVLLSIGHWSLQAIYIGLLLYAVVYIALLNSIGAEVQIEAEWSVLVLCVGFVIAIVQSKGAYERWRVQVGFDEITEGD